jgi:hypothetical protein
MKRKKFQVPGKTFLQFYSTLMKFFILAHIPLRMRIFSENWKKTEKSLLFFLEILAFL